MATDSIALRKWSLPWLVSLGGKFDPRANDVGFQALSTCGQSLTASYGSSAVEASKGAKMGFLMCNILGSIGFGAGFLQPVRRRLIGKARFDKMLAEDAALEKQPKNWAAKIGSLGFLPRSATQMLWVAALNAIGPLAAVIGTSYKGPGHEWMQPAAFICCIAAMAGYGICQTKAFGDYVTGRDELPAT